MDIKQYISPVIPNQDELTKKLEAKLNMPITLECPACHSREVMTLREYFERANYKSTNHIKLTCQICENKIELLFYNVNPKKIRDAATYYYNKYKETL
jgi:transcription elongation factor Elf1